MSIILDQSEYRRGEQPPMADAVVDMTEEERVDRALKLIRANEPDDGYYVAFSGGKDSCVVKDLVRQSGCRHECWYNQTTIDPPELVRFIKQHHGDVKWNIPKMNMMVRVATKHSLPPTRMGRWCCEEYKEHGGDGRVKVVGVRAVESPRRARTWQEITVHDVTKMPVLCPIVFWTDDQIWQYLKGRGIPYCSLYDEGWTRLGCVGCPLITKKETKEREWKRWPKMMMNWKRAIYKNWEAHQGKLRRDGLPYRHNAYRTPEDLWKWWVTAAKPDGNGDVICQMDAIWTNEGLTTEEKVAGQELYGKDVEEPKTS